jgi:hypothetical protein
MTTTIFNFYDRGFSLTGGFLELPVRHKTSAANLLIVLGEQAGAKIL